MRWSVGRQVSRRGAGLGNEIFPWAKAIIGAEITGARVVEPSWRTSRYAFGDGLRGSVAETATHVRASTLSRRTEFRSSDYLSSPHIDYRQALQSAISDGVVSRGATSLVHSSGMHGGYLGIYSAREQLRARLFSDADAARAIAAVSAARKVAVTVGVHVRRGDFASTGGLAPGAFNVATPAGWFASLVDSLGQQLSTPVQVVIASDSPSATFVGTQGSAGPPAMRPGRSPLADLGALSACDIVLPSISSFSMLSLFLGDSLYAWPTEHLHRIGDHLSIWGSESHGWGAKATAANARSEKRAAGPPRGVAMSEGDTWPAHVIEQLNSRQPPKYELTNDLIYYGVVAPG